MENNKNPKDQWESMLRFMLSEYRTKNPSDKRSDLELVTSLMDYFFENALIKKSESEKYILPEITHDS